MDEVADRVYRLGSWGVNWYLVDDGGRFTVVDAGLISEFDQLPAALGELGAAMSDVEAVVLTHAHVDHRGSAGPIQKEADASVYVHDDDVPLARGEAKRVVERSVAKDLVHPFAWRVLWWWITGGGMKSVPPLTELATYAHGETLDVPGRPRVIHTPGHTKGT